jgi:hypothetical protein
MTIQENISNFFEKFSLTNKLIFSKLKDTINNEENQIVGSLSDLSSRIKLYLGEEIILNKPDAGLTKYPTSTINLRKK